MILRVVNLLNVCWFLQDNLIERLATELARSGEPSDLLAETDRARALSATEDYNRPATPLPAEIFEVSMGYITEQSRMVRSM